MFRLSYYSFHSLFTVFVVILASGVFSTFSSRLQQLTQHLSHYSPFAVPLVTKMSSQPYSKELRIASLAVQRATLLTQTVFHEKAKGTVSKDDKSPVTIGDFGAQALIIKAIKQSFPKDEVVGEEESSVLKSNADLTTQIWQLVKETKLSNDGLEKELGKLANSDDMLAMIDEGKSAGGNKGRHWALDPIDGTKGFLRGGQYAVCLALIVDGEVKVGVLGCPNLPVDDKAPLDGANMDSKDTSQRGVLFAAVEGQGATSAPLGTGPLEKNQPIRMRKVMELTETTFCESVEAGHSSHGDQAAIAEKLRITKPSVRMDSQAKYGSIARGAGDIYLRLPTSKTYEEKIWDHAAGDLIVREAGGEVTDTLGKRLNFGIGRTLKENKGVVAAPKEVHGKVLEAVMAVLGSKA